MTDLKPAPSPIEIFDRELIRDRRNRHAASAVAHDFLLERAVDDLIDRLALVRRTFGASLVLGAHHGRLGRALRKRDATSLVVEMEAAAALLAQCGSEGNARPDVLKVQGDEEMLPFRDGSFELVVSALSLQLVNDLPGTLVQARRALKPDGLFLASMLGGRTLYELRESFLEAEAEIEGGASPRVAPFADVRDAGALLQRAGFALPVSDSDVLTVTYASPLDLMHDLRGMGGANALIARRKSPLRRATLMRCCEIYANGFADGTGRCRATFEIVTLTGWVPHESQQKPLAPGSGRVRLADALGSESGLDEVRAPLRRSDNASGQGGDSEL